jgi:hypothetical protein
MEDIKPPVVSGEARGHLLDHFRALDAAESATAGVPALGEAAIGASSDSLTSGRAYGNLLDKARAGGELASPASTDGATTGAGVGDDPARASGGYGKLLGRDRPGAEVSPSASPSGDGPSGEATPRHPTVRRNPPSELVRRGHGSLLDASRTGGEFTAGTRLVNRDTGVWEVAGTQVLDRSGTVQVTLVNLKDGTRVNKTLDQIRAQVANKDGIWSRE